MMMSIWRLLLLLPMTTTKTQLPSYPRPRGSQHRPSGRPRRRRRAGRRPLARRRPRHHHPRRHRHHFFLSKSSPRIISLFSLSLSMLWTKLREKEERESPLAGRLRASLGKERERERERERETRALLLLPLLLLFLFYVRTPCPEEGKWGGEREEEGSLQREETDSLFWCKSSIKSSLHYSLSLFKKPQKRQTKEEERKRKTKKQQTGV